MSMDFITVLSGPDQVMGVLLSSADAALTELGFRRASTVNREDLEGETGANEDLISLSDTPLIEAMDQLLNWSAASLEFVKGNLSLQIITARSSQGFTNTFVTTALSTLRRLSAARESSKLWDVTTAIAAATGSVAGYGAAELPIEFVSPEQARAGISSGMFGLIRITVASRQEAMAMAGPEYDISERSGYWILVDREYLKILSEGDRK